MAKSNIDIGREVIKIEADAVASLIDRIGREFDEAVEMIFNCNGRVIVTGMGKSGLISQKIASTLASTGTPSQFLHPGEAGHGDIGIVTVKDIILAVSNSGETPEIVQIIPAISRLGIPMIAIVGRNNSTISKKADLILDIRVEKEACTLDLAPTASTTATLAMGDALAVALLEKRGFRKNDFALLHPGGNLGKQLLLTVQEIMHSGDDIPIVDIDTDMKTTLLTISNKRLGMVVVLNKKRKLAGIITDGDIRRSLAMDSNLFEKRADFLMSVNPKWVSPDTLAINALELMEQYSITSLIVYNKGDNGGVPNGIVHIHDILKSGIM